MASKHSFLARVLHEASWREASLACCARRVISSLKVTAARYAKTAKLPEKVLDYAGYYLYVISQEKVNPNPEPNNKDCLHLVGPSATWWGGRIQAIGLKIMGKIRRCSYPCESASVHRRETKLKLPRAPLNGAGGEYIEFQLDAKTFKLVEAIARKERQSAFEVCVSLLREQLSRLRG